MVAESVSPPIRLIGTVHSLVVSRVQREEARGSRLCVHINTEQGELLGFLFRWQIATSSQRALAKRSAAGFSELLLEAFVFRFGFAQPFFGSASAFFGCGIRWRGCLRDRL